MAMRDWIYKVRQAFLVQPSVVEDPSIAEEARRSADIRRIREERIAREQHEKLSRIRFMDPEELKKDYMQIMSDIRDLENSLEVLGKQPEYTQEHKDRKMKMSDEQIKVQVYSDVLENNKKRLVEITAALESLGEDLGSVQEAGEVHLKPSVKEINLLRERILWTLNSIYEYADRIAKIEKRANPSEDWEKTTLKSVLENEKLNLVELEAKAAKLGDKTGAIRREAENLLSARRLKYEQKEAQRIRESTMKPQRQRIVPVRDIPREPSSEQTHRPYQSEIGYR